LNGTFLWVVLDIAPLKRCCTCCCCWCWTFLGFNLDGLL